MKKLYFFLTLMLVGALSVQAVQLLNKDAESHPVIIKCASTVHTEIGPNASRDIGNGPCTVTLKANGQSVTASGSSQIVIEKGGQLIKP